MSSESLVTYELCGVTGSMGEFKEGCRLAHLHRRSQSESSGLNANGFPTGLLLPDAVVSTVRPIEKLGQTAHRLATRQDLSLKKDPDLGRPGTAKVRVGVFAQLDYFLFADNTGVDRHNGILAINRQEA